MNARLLVTLLATFVAACGGDVAAPPAIAAVAVTSPRGNLWDIGANVALTAAARDAQGNAITGITFTWTSTNPQIVSVSPAGAVQALAVGSATIRAQTGGWERPRPVCALQCPYPPQERQPDDRGVAH